MRRKRSVAVLAVLLFPAVAVASCKPGFVPSDVEGVCVEVAKEATHPEWTSDEKPPQRGWNPDRSDAVTAPDLTAADIKADRERDEADKQGKKSAGLK